MIATTFALVALFLLVVLIWGSVGMATWIMWLTIGDLYGPPAKPGSTRVPGGDAQRGELEAAVTDAAERAWADQWAARAGRGA